MSLLRSGGRIDLFSDASVAIDGSEFKAVNTRDRNFTQAKMQCRLEQIDESIVRYLSQLEIADRQGPTVPEAKITRLNEKIAALREEIQWLNASNARMMETSTIFQPRCPATFSASRRRFSIVGAWAETRASREQTNRFFPGNRARPG